MQSRKKLRPGIKLALGFMIIIASGALLLFLPLSHKSGVDISFLDSLFISTSAVCVTGLTPIDISQSLSLFGSTVMMLLIQIGGLGFAVIAVLVINIANGGKIDFSSSNLLRDSLGADNKISAKKLLNLALSVTFIIEALGALFLFFPFFKQYDFPTALYYAIFHSVSAFNNAGFDLFSDSMMKWRESPLVLITISSLIALGGLGFLVYGNIFNHIRYKEKISVHTKIVISTTVFLIVFGTVLFYFVLPSADLKNAFFQSVTARTAGFFSSDQSTLNSASVILTIILMFIGASPGSTGGGVKTTTFYTAIKASFSLLLGKEPISFKRSISSESVMKAFFVIVISLLIVSTAVLLLSITDPKFSSSILLYEVVSAYATVGLTMGATPEISGIGKIILILLMFLGRVGILTIITAFAKRGKAMVKHIEEKILIG